MKFSLDSAGQRLKRLRCFAGLIRSPWEVRHAFDGDRILSWWWHGVLALHGKPLKSHLTLKSRTACIAEGYRFYGLLYRFLAVVIGAAALACWFLRITGLFWMTLAYGSAVYLWVVSGLAFSGACEFSSSHGRRAWRLVSFLIFISLFLIGSLAAISVQLRHSGAISDVMNILVTVGMMMFGVGSYFIELAALVTDSFIEDTAPV